MKMCEMWMDIHTREISSKSDVSTGGKGFDCHVVIQHHHKVGDFGADLSAKAHASSTDG